MSQSQCVGSHPPCDPLLTLPGGPLPHQLANCDIGCLYSTRPEGPVNPWIVRY